MKKKMLSLILALTMCLGLCVPAMADARTSGANPAPGTYGPYTITGSAYGDGNFKITFDSVKIEEKTLQIRDNSSTVFDMGGSGGLGSYESVKVKVVTVKPSTYVSVESYPSYGGTETFCQLMEYGTVDGDGKYSMEPKVMGEIHQGPASKAFTGMTDQQKTSGFARIYGTHTSDGMDYLFFFENTASGGFTDVKAGAYYEDAVKWAVKQGITSGTTDTTFSPDDTCTIGQVLTFIWRANGSPEPLPMGGPAYTSSQDYYFTPVAWAYSEGMVPLDVRPDEPCTRAMAARFLWELAGSPAAGKSGGYAPYTINGKLAGLGVPFTIQMDAAPVEKATVTFCKDINNEYGDYDESGDAIIHDPYQRQVTVVRGRPGSRLTVNSRIPESIRGGELEDGMISIDYCHADTKGVYHGDAYQTSVGMLFSCDLDYEGRGYLVLAEEETYLIITSANTGFSDIPAVANYTQAVAWAVEQGITSGTGSGRFSPDDTCTRGQIVTFLHRALGK